MARFAHRDFLRRRQHAGYEAPVPFAGDGGMWTLTGSSAANRLVSSVGTPQQAIIDAAGPRGNVAAPFFAVTTDQVHRWPVCGDPASLTPAWQVQ